MARVSKVLILAAILAGCSTTEGPAPSAVYSPYVPNAPRSYRTAPLPVSAQAVPEEAPPAEVVPQIKEIRAHVQRLRDHYDAQTIP
jgi:PBP1b-binding outer membrane lipoprotein LpoB